MHSIITEAKKLFFDKCGFELSNIEIEKESSEYCAHRFEINNKKILFRQAKLTPTKVGQFVTLWKRNLEKNTIEPFDISDNIDFFIINVKTENKIGQFVFPKSILIEKGVISSIKEGKRAIRVYPIWDSNLNKQAQKTQKWQLNYFIEILENENFDNNKLKMLYNF